MQLLRLASALLATPAVARAPATADTCCTLRSMAVATCFTYLSPASHGDVIMASSLPGCPPTHVAALACAALGTLARDDVAAGLATDAVTAGSPRAETLNDVDLDFQRTGWVVRALAMPGPWTWVGEVAPPPPISGTVPPL